MCIWQRYPHGVAIARGLVLLFLGRGRAILALGALAAMTTAGLGMFHTGVERGWWEGPSACIGGASDLSAMTGADLLSFETAETRVLLRRRDAYVLAFRRWMPGNRFGWQRFARTEEPEC